MKSVPGFGVGAGRSDRPDEADGRRQRRAATTRAAIATTIARRRIDDSTDPAAVPSTISAAPNASGTLSVWASAGRVPVAATVSWPISIRPAACRPSSSAARAGRSTCQDTATAPLWMSVVTVGWMLTTSERMGGVPGRKLTPGFASGAPTGESLGMRRSSTALPPFVI